jgi:hypothetical protein
MPSLVTPAPNSLPTHRQSAAAVTLVRAAGRRRLLPIPSLSVWADVSGHAGGFGVGRARLGAGLRGVPRRLRPNFGEPTLLPPRLRRPTPCPRRSHACGAHTPAAPARLPRLRRLVRRLRRPGLLRLRCPIPFPRLPAPARACGVDACGVRVRVRACGARACPRLWHRRLRRPRLRCRRLLRLRCSIPRPRRCATAACCPAPAATPEAFRGSAGLGRPGGPRARLGAVVGCGCAERGFGASRRPRVRCAAGRRVGLAGRPGSRSGRRDRPARPSGSPRFGRKRRGTPRNPAPGRACPTPNLPA